MSNEKELEQEIQDKGLNAPRLTPDLIDQVIEKVVYFTASDGCEGSVSHNPDTHPSLDLLTFCVIVLKNGYTVTGESACASPENFNEEIGRKIALSNAREKVWMLEGYLLKERLFNAK